MPYDALMRWETEGGATGRTNGEKSAERPSEEDAEKPDPSLLEQASDQDQGWIKPRRIA
jgi:hypothetical protein